MRIARSPSPLPLGSSPMLFANQNRDEDLALFEPRSSSLC